MAPDFRIIPLITCLDKTGPFCDSDSSDDPSASSRDIFPDKSVSGYRVCELGAKECDKIRVKKIVLRVEVPPAPPPLETKFT